VAAGRAAKGATAPGGTVQWAVAARGYLPPGAKVCVAAPANQISFAIRVFFRISDMGLLTNHWGPLLFPPLSFPALCPTTLPFLILPLP